MTYTEFLSCQFPEKSVFARKDRDPFQNLVKWLALHVAYRLFKMNATANLVTVITYLISLSGFLMLSTARYGFQILPVIGALLIHFHVFADFIDGTIAKANGTASRIGAILDDLGMDTDRMALIILFGIFTQNTLILILNLFTAGVLVLFVPQAYKDMPRTGLLGKFCHLYIHRYSFLSVRFMLGVVPLFLIVAIFMEWNLKFLSYGFSVLYAVAALIWLLLTARQ